MYSNIRQAQNDIMAQAQGLTGLYISCNGTKYYARRNGNKVTVKMGRQSRTMKVIDFARGLI